MSLIVAASYLGDWLDVLFRWFHVIVGVTWLGTSIYFVRLDNSLAPPAEGDDESESSTIGEHWGVHAGGFYHVVKYRRLAGTQRAPAHQATPWPAYSTWLTGFTLITVVYYANPRTYLIDTSVANLAPAAAVAISIGFLLVGWLLYDLTCRLLGRWEWLVALSLVAIVIGAALAATSLFSPRAAFLQVGAMLGTFMSANVLFIIQPTNRRQAASQQGKPLPEPSAYARAKQRSVHNTYLTLPVLFLMLSNHAPFIYGSSDAWLALFAMLVVGALIRHSFILYRRGSVPMVPTVAPLAATAIVIALVFWMAPPSTTAPETTQAAGGADSGQAAASGAASSAGAQVFASAGCASCHTLKAAGASGKVGPDLDSLHPSQSVVAETVANGRGAMPPFKGRLSDEQISAVAAYVATATGGG
ncbi:MAG: urate hydroxylase PuuD [Solirubrobacteraceae bacterium]